jgi:hypothetical protein
VFFRTTKAFVTSPMPWVTSMLVLQPRISTERAGPLGEPVGVALGVSLESEGVHDGVFVVVGTEKLVAVATWGVEVTLATPITTGVGVKMEGVLVGGRNGVGGLNGPGWSTQPLQDAKRSIESISRIAGMVFFILFSSYHCTPHAT